MYIWSLKIVYKLLTLSTEDNNPPDKIMAHTDIIKNIIINYIMVLTFHNYHNPWYNSLYNYKYFACDFYWPQAFLLHKNSLKVHLGHYYNKKADMYRKNYLFKDVCVYFNHVSNELNSYFSKLYELDFNEQLIRYISYI